MKLYLYVGHCHYRTNYSGFRCCVISQRSAVCGLRSAIEDCGTDSGLGCMNNVNKQGPTRINKVAAVRSVSTVYIGSTLDSRPSA